MKRREQFPFAGFWQVRWALAGCGLLGAGTGLRAETPACPAGVAAPAIPAQMAYQKGDTADAELLYKQELLKQPGNPELVAGLARTRLRLGEVDEALRGINEGLRDAPHAAPLLTALAETQLRQGEPWMALETLRSAAQADPCFARVHLLRSRIDRLESMYSSERNEIAAAYALSPADPEIKHAWAQTVSPANDILSTQKYLATEQHIDPELRKAAENSVASMMPLLSETSQTCRVLPALASATLPLMPSMQDGRHVDGYRLEVHFPQTKASLQLDTAASGLYISRALAEQNGLVARPEDAAGTVHADSLQIGPLEFRDCVVGVSDVPFAGKAAGFIGTDLFGSYLITLDQPNAKLVLDPLPPAKSTIPEDRTRSPELAGFSPVYHKQQYLLAPVMVNRKERRLFVLDTGIRLSTMTPQVAHMVSSTQHNFTNPMRTTSGATLQIYRDNFDFEFANMSLPSRSNVLEFDGTALAQRTGLAIGGMLGFDILHTMVLHLDYRDGLVKFESEGSDGGFPRRATEIAGADKLACEHGDASDVPAAVTIEARSTGLWESGHMKPGERISAKVVHGWISPVCRLDEGSLLYGHVTAASASKDSQGRAQLGLEFDQADCFGGVKKTLPLKLLSVVAAPGEFVGIHTAMPSAIGSGRGKNIADAASGVDNSLGDEVNLNPEKTPGIVHPGTVRGLPKLELQADGGPGCSALLTTAERSLHLGPQTKFVLVMQDVAKP